ncbi:response regulator transcription factor [Mucilaginibacter roseus]|uniref:Response regulator transcription factor n=1 Tax=Mucilaginibacter roseus TaxID=1528868 RepID=A0ABS8U2Q0_9SPHI|nr:response regulator transcription factor [Mucilaginibacter roseus]MCD8739831.1 response regulator transcription factor [Mucilaginibacter roseus]
MIDKTTVYLADDHAIVVEGLIEILRSQPDLHVIGTAANGEEVIQLMQNRRADIVVLDINMPKMNGIKCTQQIKQQFPATKVIVLTMFPEKSYVDQLIRAGADGCLLKSRGSQDLLHAIARVKTSRSYFDTIRDFDAKDEKPLFQLSEREFEIIRLIVNGLTTTQIAEKLFLSEHTVKTHRKNIFRKIGINSVSQLTAFAINHQLMG